MEIKKALTFRASSIGDCLMGKYLLENIHNKFPDAKCAIVVGSRAKMIRDLLSEYPWIEVIEANRRNFKSLFYVWKNFAKSDLVITQYAGKRGGKFSLGSKFMARFLAKKGGLLGFYDISPWNDYLYDFLLPVNQHLAIAEHEREVVKKAGIPVSMEYPILSSHTNPKIIEQFGLTFGNFFVVHLFAGGKGRGLHPKNKKELLISLARKTEMKIVVSGGKQDLEEIQHICEGTDAVIIAGKTSLQELMSIISESAGVISVDTGVAHITAQLKKPLVVMRTCVAPNWWFKEQYGPHAPITVLSSDETCGGNHIYKDYPACINEIPIEKIINTVSI